MLCKATTTSPLVGGSELVSGSAAVAFGLMFGVKYTRVEPFIEPPPAQGVRTEWQAVPEHIRKRFEAWAGSPVIAAITQPSGFSPGVAARLQLADGRSLFVKAIGSEPNPDSPAF